MMPDLGKYAATVLSAYGGALALLVALVAEPLAVGAGGARPARGGGTGASWPGLNR